MSAAERRWGTGGWCSGVVWWGGLEGSEVPLVWKRQVVGKLWEAELRKMVVGWRK